MTDGETRDRVIDTAVAIAGAGAAFTGTEMDGIAGAGLAVAGVAVPSAWLAYGASRTRRRLRSEQAGRRRMAAMSAAQDARIQTLRQRLRELDSARTVDRDELRLTTAGLMATKVQLAAMRTQLDVARGELDGARGELDTARRELVEMRDELAALLGRAVAEAQAQLQIERLPDLVLPGAPTEAPAAQLILPSQVTAARVPFEAAERSAFEALEADLDDLTGILTVSEVMAEARSEASRERSAAVLVPDAALAEVMNDDHADTDHDGDEADPAAQVASSAA